MQIVQDLLVNPEKYVATQSLAHVRAYLVGHDNCAVLLGRKDVIASPPREFHEWASRKYGVGSGANAYVAYTLFASTDVNAIKMYIDDLSAFQRASSRPTEATQSGGLQIELWTMFASLRMRYEFYICTASINYLRAYLDGFMFAAKNYAPLSMLEPDLNDYEAWLNTKHVYSKRVCWDKILLVQGALNEQRAFSLFFETIEQYARERGIGGKLSSGTDE